MSIANEIKEGLAGIKTDLDELAKDIDFVLAKLEGSSAEGMTATEAQEIRALVAGLKGKSRSLADRVTPDSGGSLEP